MATFYVTSDLPSAGKTAVAGAMAARLSGSGKAVAYYKPFSSAPEDDADLEFIRSRILPGTNGEQPRPLAMPESTKESHPLAKTSIKEIKRSIKILAYSADTVLVEGPSLTTGQGGASSVSEELVEVLDAQVLVIMSYGPDFTVDRVLQMCLPFKSRLFGVLINSVSRFNGRDVGLSLAPAIESQGLRLLGAIPEDRVMLSVTLEQVAHHLGAQWSLGEDKSQELVESFLIGGNIMDSGTTYFGRTSKKVVIVRGDRPDIQLAALSTPTTGLILTSGHQPIQYVHYQAEQEGVPLLVVEDDTLSTAASLDNVLDLSTIYHPEKLERFQHLMEEHAGEAI